MEDVVGGSFKLNTGHRIPMIGLGTYKIVGEMVNPAIDAALSAGYRLFDTAVVYENEAYLGNAFENLLPKHGLERKDIFIVTKVLPHRENSEAAVTRLVEESLQKLRTSYIDMCLIHYPSASDSKVDDPLNKEDRKNAYIALERLKESGKIRSVGVSNYEIVHLEEIKEYGTYVPCANQVEYHPHLTRNELRHYCGQNGIFFQAFSSLAKQDPALFEEPLIRELAKKYNTSIQHLLLAWAHCQNIGIIPKSATPQRIADNMKIHSLKLSAEDIEYMSQLNRNKNYTRCQPWLVS